MKTILLPMQSSAISGATLMTAMLLAQRTGAYIEGFALRSNIPQFVVSELTSGFSFETYQAQRDEEAAELRHAFEKFMLDHNIPRAGNDVDGPSFGWLADAPDDDGFVGSYGRAFDATVITRPEATKSVHQRTIESALFESGRPVLLAPPTAPTAIATNIMIHWNGSTEQARANAAAMPLLRLADRVTVLTVIGGQDVPGPQASHIVRQLRYNGIAAKAMSLEIEGRDTGEAVLDAARRAGCDLLIKGAFTRNRLRQMIFGGATSHIIEHADLPVLMAH